MRKIHVVQYRNYKDFKFGTLEILFQNEKEIIIDGILKRKNPSRCKFLKIIHGDRY